MATREWKTMNVHLRINLTLYFAALAWSTTRVKNDLGIHASEEDKTDGPISVAEDGATQENHLDIYRGFLSVASYGSIEPVHVGIGTVAFDCERVELSGAVLRGAKIRKSRRGIARLEVGFAIEVLSFEKGDVFVIRGSAYKDVCGNGIVVHDFDKVADAYVLPEGLAPVNVRWLGTRCDLR